MGGSNNLRFYQQCQHLAQTPHPPIYTHFCQHVRQQNYKLSQRYGQYAQDHGHVTQVYGHITSNNVRISGQHAQVSGTVDID